MNLSYLFLLFLVLKLTGIIAWSWWFVTMPLWIAPVFMLVFIVGMICFAVLVMLIAAITGR